MREKKFPNGLIVKHRRSAIILEDENEKDEQKSQFVYVFTNETLKHFTDYIIKIANEAWTGITPKIANSMASDYDEYYDRKYDNNGYLAIVDYLSTTSLERTTAISIRAPHLSKDTLYQFNKAKIQAFIYDLQQKIKEYDAHATNKI